MCTLGGLPFELLYHISSFCTIKHAIMFCALFHHHQHAKEILWRRAKSPLEDFEQNYPIPIFFIVRNFAWHRFLHYLDTSPFLSPHQRRQVLSICSTWSTRPLSERHQVSHLLQQTWHYHVRIQPCPTFHVLHAFPFLHVNFSANLSISRSRIERLGITIGIFIPPHFWILSNSWTSEVDHLLTPLFTLSARDMVGKFTTICPFCGQFQHEKRCSQTCLFHLAQL